MYNKPILEDIALDQKGTAIFCFERQAEIFEPFWHYHPEIELTYIKRGQGIRFVGDHIEAYGPGDLILIGRNLPHQWVSKEGHRDQHAIVLQFGAELFSTYDELEMLEDLLNQSKCGFSFSKVPSHIIKKLESITQLPAPLGLSTLIEILYALNGLERRSLDSGKHPFKTRSKLANEQKINTVLNYILENLSEALTVDHMAQFTHMIPQSFCRWFKQCTGVSYIQYLNKCRLEACCQDLAQTDQSIRNIAHRWGFENISHFNRTFRKHLKCSPREYRQRH